MLEINDSNLKNIFGESDNPKIDISSQTKYEEMYFDCFLAINYNK